MAENLRPVGVGIVTDGAADNIRREGVLVVPINIMFEKDSYETGIELDTNEFRRLVKETGIIPKTSIPNRFRFFDAYDKLVGGQNLDVVSIHVGSNLSGTCDMAEGVAKEYNGRVKVFDSGTVSGAQGLMVRKAQDMANSGATSEEIMEMLTGIKE